MSPPPVVVDTAAHWQWGMWPHPVVVHEYVVHDQPVYIEHHHYYPFYDRIHHVHHDHDHDHDHDHGRHEGWYKHHGDDD